MSRSYRKHIVIYMCTGNNGPYYKMRRRKYRRKLNHELRDLNAKCTPEELDEKYVGEAGLKPFRNLWDEPTDGHYAVDKTGLKQQLKRYERRKEWYESLTRYLKPKKRKH